MAYTEGTLLGYMETELGPLLAQLGLDASDALAEGVAEIAALLGSPIADVDDDLKLRTLARWQAWRVALGAAVGQYDLASSGDSVKRDQVFQHLRYMLAMAEAAAMQYEEVAAILAGGATAYVTSTTPTANPYAWPTTSGGW